VFADPQRTPFGNPPASLIDPNRSAVSVGFAASDRYPSNRLYNGYRPDMSRWLEALLLKAVARDWKEKHWNGKALEMSRLEPEKRFLQRRI
jgi:hypothetical protein